MDCKPPEELEWRWWILLLVTLLARSPTGCILTLPLIVICLLVTGLIIACHLVVLQLVTFVAWLFSTIRKWVWKE